MARNLFAQAQQQFGRVHHRLGSSPLIMFLLGGLVLFLWACTTIVQIQTSEYLAMGANTRVAGVAWGILFQPWLMLTGQAPIAYATAWLYGWIVEVITLIFALALAVAVTKISIANPHIGKWFVVGGLLLIILNSWADYSASPGSSPLVQGLIALAVGGMAVVGLPLGIGLLEHGASEIGE
jgi:hypothetical protein